MTRTFIALKADEQQQEVLAQIIQQGRKLLPALRWVEPTSIHLTLAFLGELDNSALTRARQGTSEAATGSPAFTYRLSGLGTFGPSRQPRVLWMGLNEPTGALHTLHQRLSAALEKRGFPPEERGFSPHLTLARITSSLSPEQLHLLQQLLASHQTAGTAYRVTHLAVMKSELIRGGAKYTCLEACALGSTE